MGKAVDCPVRGLSCFEHANLTPEGTLPDARVIRDGKSLGIGCEASFPNYGIKWSVYFNYVKIHRCISRIRADAI
jgi:hypothetical protein